MTECPVAGLVPRGLQLRSGDINYVSGGDDG